MHPAPYPPDPRIRFTGFYRSAQRSVLCGQFLAHGTATFRSGRQQAVWYQSSAVVPEAVEDDCSVVDQELAKAYAELLGMMKMAENGFLPRWLNGHRARPVQSVVWQEW